MVDPEQLSSRTCFRDFGHSQKLSRLCPPQNIIVFVQVLYAKTPICIKYLDENNNILGVDTADDVQVMAGLVAS